MTTKTKEPLLEEDNTTNSGDGTPEAANSLTVIVEVLDMSGSMAHGGFIDEVRNGYNHYIKKNVDMPGRAVVFTTLFDTDIGMVVDGQPVEDVPELTSEVYRPRGGTALNDAVAFSIQAVDDWIAAQPEGEKPDNVVVEIQTDGEENSSMKYSRYDSDAMAAFREIISGKEADGWVFSYIGTNGDAFSAAVEMGISRGMAASTSADMSKNAAGNAAYFSSKLDLMSNVRAAGANQARAADLYKFTADQKASMSAESKDSPSLIEEEGDND